jgi:hypothetical protein
MCIFITISPGLWVILDVLEASLVPKGEELDCTVALDARQFLFP